jgi:hypothetical protein
MALSGMLIASCGGASPTQPVPHLIGDSGGNVGPPANAAPTIDSISAQGRRSKEPPRFADVNETIDLSATVTDPETAADELVYEWTASTGTINGSGGTVTWTAPDTIGAPETVTITLKVVENYGYPGQAKIYSQEVSATQTLSLHDSANEVGEMSRQFLLDFSDTNIKDWRHVMRNFNAAACPQPVEVEKEKDDVVRNYTGYQMVDFRIGRPRVSVNFGGVCEFRGTLGDACAVVPSYWDSIQLSSGARASVNGDDIIAAAYSSKDARWWLCASDYRAIGTVAPSHLSYVR